MGRRKNRYYWNQVDREEDGGLKCKHCGLKFKGGISRFKAHITGTQGKGIRICPNPPTHSTYLVHSKQHRNVIATTSQGIARGGETTNIVGGSTLLGGIEVVEGSIEIVDVAVNSEINTTLLEGNEAESANAVMTTLQRNLDEFISNLTSEEDDLKEQLQYLKSEGKKRKRVVDEWFDKLQNMKQRAVDMKNSLNQSGWPNFNVQEGEIRHLITGMQNHKKCKPLVLSNEFVGRKFEGNVKKMWKLLRDDRVFIIGICGMGGVGKTFLATYIYTEIKRSKIFEDVLWVTVSHDFNVSKLQENIAKEIKVNLCEYNNEKSRAVILASELRKRKNTVLILDDTWKYIDLKKVGIPLGVKGIKVVITSRLRHVQCLSDNMIEVGAFYEDDEYEEAWELFLLQLQDFGTPPKLPPQVRDMARCVVSKCDGLPLAISVMARIMIGKTSIHQWRYALDQFDKWLMREEMEKEVLSVLRRSYDNLTEKEVKNCFLYSALLPKSFVREDLIMMLVDMGLLNGRRSLEKIFDEGNDIVEKLINHSLLLEHNSILRMQGLVKKMAWNILKESDANKMLKCNEHMKSISELEWSTDLETVSLANNTIEEIPDGTSLNCPRLSTLLLFYNSIGHIPEGFFTYMNALTTLGLSEKHNLTRLPRSLSNVRSLTSLMLYDCSELNDIPPLGELQSLLRLQISGCSIEALPEGLKNLIKLKWLDLSNNVNLELVPGSFLSSLTNIQYLNLWLCSGGIEVEDVEGMTRLECFAGTFVNQDNLNRYVREILDSANGPQTYLIHYLDWKQNGRKRPLWRCESRLSTFMCRTMSFRDCNELSHVLPRGLLKLLLDCNDHWVCVCDALSSNDSSPLKEICIQDWTKLTSMFCSSCSFCTRIRKLQSLKLDYLESLTTIFKELPPRGMFSHLKTLDVYKCHRIKILLPSRLVRNLQNLESVIVSHCDSMEQIFALAYDDTDKNDENDDDGDGDEDEEEDEDEKDEDEDEDEKDEDEDEDEDEEDEDNEGEHDDNNKIRLPKLNCLKVIGLPQLKTVCEGVLICKSGVEPIIIDCPKLSEPRIE